MKVHPDLVYIVRILEWMRRGKSRGSLRIDFAATGSTKSTERILVSKACFPWPEPLDSAFVPMSQKNGVDGQPKKH